MQTELDDRIDATEGNWGDPVVVEATRGNYVNSDGSPADPHIVLTVYGATLADLEADDEASTVAMERDGSYTPKVQGAGALLFVSQARELAALLFALAVEAEEE